MFSSFKGLLVPSFHLFVFGFFLHMLFRERAMCLTWVCRSRNISSIKTPYWPESSVIPASTLRTREQGMADYPQQVMQWSQHFNIIQACFELFEGFKWSQGNTLSFVSLASCDQLVFICAVLWILYRIPTKHLLLVITHMHTQSGKNALWYLPAHLYR